MTNDDELQRLLEQGDTSTEEDFGVYKLVFDGLKSSPKKLTLKNNFSRNVMHRINSKKESPYGDKFWITIGVIIFLISGVYAVSLTTTGFSVFKSVFELKGYIIIFVVLATLFKVIEKRLHLDFTV
ncbi:MAG TPA: hypothetical protein PKL31_14470 [Fulvivirga sp.]|nr:hypothetical protein [Fulvivirga sp.]